MSTYTERARALRPYIVKSAASLTDADASLAPELFTRLTGSGSLVKAGMRINWGGTIKRAASDLWDTAQNTPDAAPGPLGRHRLQAGLPPHPRDHHRRPCLLKRRKRLVAGRALRIPARRQRLEPIR